MGASQFCEVARGPDFKTAYNDAHATSALESGTSYGGNLGTKTGCISFGQAPKGWDASRTFRAVEDLVYHVEFGPEDGADDERVLIRDEWFDLGNPKHLLGRIGTAKDDAAALVEALGDRKAAAMALAYLDKWGPAVAVRVDATTWAICGMASS